MTEHDATLERRLYARIDEVFTPINGELDAVNGRLAALAASYASLRAGTEAAVARVVRDSGCDPDLYAAVKKLSAKLEAAEIRVSDAHRRCDALAATNERNDSGISALRAVVEQTGKAVQSLAERVEDLETSHPSAKLREDLDRQIARIDALSCSLEKTDNNVERVTGIATNAAGRIAQLESWAKAHAHPAPVLLAEYNALSGRISALESAIDTACNANVGCAPEPQDIYEVDGRPATKAEYEAAENDSRVPHTTRHVHRPFSDPEPCAETRDIGWAMAQLRMGKRVRISRWTPGIYWALERDENNEVVRYIPDSRLDSGYEVGQPQLSAMYLAATDWEIAP